MTLHEVLFAIREAYEAGDLARFDAARMAQQAIFWWPDSLADWDGDPGWLREAAKERTRLIAWALEWVWSRKWTKNEEADWHCWPGFQHSGFDTWEWDVDNRPSAPWLARDHLPNDPIDRLRYGNRPLHAHYPNLHAWAARYRPEQLAALEADDGIPF